MFCQVRQVLTLALRRWGFQVCAVKNEADAITKLSLRGKSRLAFTERQLPIGSCPLIGLSEGNTPAIKSTAN